MPAWLEDQMENIGSPRDVNQVRQNTIVSNSWCIGCRNFAISECSPVHSRECKLFRLACVYRRYEEILSKLNGKHWPAWHKICQYYDCVDLKRISLLRLESMHGVDIAVWKSTTGVVIKLIPGEYLLFPSTSEAVSKTLPRGCHTRWLPSLPQSYSQLWELIWTENGYKIADVSMEK